MSEQQELDGVPGWHILELFGHRKLAGYVREVTVAGAGFVQLEIPKDDGWVATQRYNPSAVYCMTPTTEEIARGFAKRHQPEPVTRWELPPAITDSRPEKYHLDDYGEGIDPES